MWGFSTPRLHAYEVKTQREQREMVNTKLISRI